MEVFSNIYVIGDRTPLLGPADYTVSRAFTDKKGISISPRYSFSTSRPDPYLVNLKSTLGDGPKVTISPRYRDLRRDDVPGPNYTPPPFGQVTGIRFPRAKSPRAPRNPNPSPQDYRPIYETDVGIRKNVMATIGTARRPSIFNGDPSTPSAGNYNPRFKYIYNDSPRISIGHKYKERKKDRTGEYVAPRTTLSARGCDFGRGSGRVPIMH